MYKKNFQQWYKVMIRLEENSHKTYVREGEIRWVVMGVNIGSEIDGKGKYFTRPVLVIGVVSSKIALVASMSTNLKNIRGNMILNWKRGPSSVNINQLKVISTKRFLDRISKIPKNKLQKIKNQIKEFYNF